MRSFFELNDHPVELFFLSCRKNQSRMVKNNVNMQDEALKSNQISLNFLSLFMKYDHLFCRNERKTT